MPYPFQSQRKTAATSRRVQMTLLLVLALPMTGNTAEDIADLSIEALMDQEVTLVITKPIHIVVDPRLLETD